MGLQALLIFWRIGTVNPEGRAYRLRRRANTIGKKHRPCSSPSWSGDA
ncbi:hypothetical protein AZ78_1862 [Lysobacter capsici AZ78]|uniref:Uncharacterized protein n=1 Tax=Lysobacter capsici AZ78 TaxID=1444315 RepID=A0A120AGB5_9GAMM|nr:hypothetical protein AZ78_1862 [Lysobacter capsici AZ78]